MLVTLITDTLLLQVSSPGKASIRLLSLYTDPAVKQDFQVSYLWWKLIDNGKISQSKQLKDAMTSVF